MAFDGRLISDVRRIASEGRDGTLLLLTGPKGSGKTFTLKTFADGIASDGRSHVCTSLTSCLDSKVPLGGQPEATPCSLQVVWLTYSLFAAEAERVRSILQAPLTENKDSFASGTVVIVDALEVLWGLCSINGSLHGLQILLRALLCSRGCVLVGSANSENSVPTALLEWRRPLVYAIPALTEAAARRAVYAGFGEGEQKQFGDLSACVPALLPTTTRGSLLLAMCAEKGARAVHGCPDAGSDDETKSVVRLRKLLHWIEQRGVASDSPQQLNSCKLYGVREVHDRALMLISVFAAPRIGTSPSSKLYTPQKTGKLLASMKSTTGILLYGPSGCGKSALARQLASELPEVVFSFVKCTTLFSKYLGESEEKLRQVYRRARARAPSVVVLDDIDVIAQGRGEVGSGEDGGSGPRGGVNVNKRMLAGLLCELDGVTDNSGVLTIGTTNAPDVIDSALLRQGRLETMLFVGPLTRIAAAQMCDDFFQTFKGSDAERKDNVDLIASAATDRTPAALRYVLRKVLERQLSDHADADGTLQGTVNQLPMPAVAQVATILAEARAMMPRAQSNFSSS